MTRFRTQPPHTIHHVKVRSHHASTTTTSTTGDDSTAGAAATTTPAAPALLQPAVTHTSATPAATVGDDDSMSTLMALAEDGGPEAMVEEDRPGEDELLAQLARRDRAPVPSRDHEEEEWGQDGGELDA
jgi:hypothetical protein